MGTVTVQSVLDAAIIILQDTTGVRWPAAELVPWVTAGQREAVVFKPSAYSKNEPVLLSAGTKQTIPAGGVQLLNIVRNMGSGAAAGRGIRLIEREVLDANVPDWHTETAAAVTKHFVYDANDPKTFYVYPPANGSTYAEIVYSAAPPAATLNGVISIDDIYASALTDYVLYRAYQKDAEYASDPARANGHYTAFVTAMAGRDKAEKSANPNNANTGNPNVVRG